MGPPPFLPEVRSRSLAPPMHVHACLFLRSGRLASRMCVGLVRPRAAPPPTAPLGPLVRDPLPDCLLTYSLAVPQGPQGWDLYELLGLEPGCSADDIKRVSEITRGPPRGLQHLRMRMHGHAHARPRTGTHARMSSRGTPSNGEATTCGRSDSCHPRRTPSHIAALTSRLPRRRHTARLRAGLTPTRAAAPPRSPPCRPRSRLCPTRGAARCTTRTGARTRRRRRGAGEGGGGRAAWQARISSRWVECVCVCARARARVYGSGPHPQQTWFKQRFNASSTARVCLLQQGPARS